MINSRGYSVPKGGAEVETAKKKLTVRPLQFSGVRRFGESFPVFRESSTRLYMPRAFGIETFGPATVNRCDERMQPISSTLEFKGELREHQKQSVELITQNYEGKNGSCLLCLPCGYGKTCVAIYMIAKMKVKTLILVHKEFLMTQWVERIQEFLPGTRIGYIQQTKCDVEDKDVVIGMIQSVSSRDYDRSVFDRFGQLVVDECFPYRTYIQTDAEEGPIPIGSLFEKWQRKEKLPKILSYNEKTKIFEYKEMTHAWRKGKKDVIQVKVQSGDGDVQEFWCTPEHKILTKNGYKQAKQLNSDVLVYYSKSALWSPVDYSGSVGVPPAAGRQEEVYDIEVEDNHNFVIVTGKVGDGPVVSNCHHIAAKAFSECMFKAQAKYMLGLSATPDRTDGMTILLKWFFGAFEIPIKRPQNTSVQVDIIKNYEGFSALAEVGVSTKKETVTGVVTNLTNMQHRNELLLNKLKTLDLTKRKVLLLSDRRDHLSYLQKQINEDTHFSGFTCGLYIGGMKADALKESEACNILLSTFTMTAEGFDVPSLNTLVMSTPKSNIEQAVGRILRKVGEVPPLVIDIYDNHSLLEGMYWKRMRFYKKNGYVIGGKETVKTVSERKTRKLTEYSFDDSY